MFAYMHVGLGEILSVRTLNMNTGNFNDYFSRIPRKAMNQPEIFVGLLPRALRVDAVRGRSDGCATPCTLAMIDISCRQAFAQGTRLLLS